MNNNHSKSSGTTKSIAKTKNIGDALPDKNLQANDESQWVRMSFKGNKVWVQTDANGNITEQNGKVLIKYQLAQEFEYRVHRSSIKSADKENLKPKKKKKSNSTSANTTPTDKSNHEISPTRNIIRIYTDGASSGNPGPSGIGVVLQYEAHEKTISKYIGIGTNNIAELEAIKTALLSLKKTNIPIQLYTDSSYALGLLVKNWKVKKNQELVQSIKSLLKTFQDIKLLKVKGHAGIKGNELADKLATEAVKKQT